MSDKTKPADDLDAAYLTGKADGSMIAYGALRALGRDDLANQLLDIANEMWAMAARIRRHADDAEVVTVH